MVVAFKTNINCITKKRKYVLHRGRLLDSDGACYDIPPLAQFDVVLHNGNYEWRGALH